MKSLTPKSAACTKITVTNTATKLFTLMDTAGTTANNESHYAQLGANAVVITPEDGDIRILFGTNPTATQGTLLQQGRDYYLTNVNLEDMRLIRKGSSNVACSVEPYVSRQDEGRAAAGGSVGSTGASASQVQGTSANGTTAVGNPVQTGGIYETTPTVLTNGQTATWHFDANQNGLVSMNTLLSGENQSANRIMTSRPGTSVRITTATTTTLITGTGSLIGVLIEVALTGTLTIYDNTAASGTIISILPIGTPAGYHYFNARFNTGCTFVTSAADRVVGVTEPN